MPQNIALFPGNIIYTDDLLSYSLKIKLLISNKRLLSKWKKFVDAEHFDINQVVNIDYKVSINPAGSLAYSDVVRYVLNDSSVYHILRRKISAKSLYEIDLYAERVIYWCVDRLLSHKIDCVIHHHTPHEVVSYIFSRVAEFFKIPVFVIRKSPIPWRAYIQRGAFDGILLERQHKAIKADDYGEMGSFLKKKTQDYNQAIPEYEKERLIRLNGKFWSWKKEIRVALNRRKNPLKSFYSLYHKFKLYQFFQAKVSNREKWSSKFVTFYLHYQPERTTLPEGGIFNQQIIAIRLLRMLLPMDISIVVREHPSTFRNSFSLSTRSELFYSRITALVNVHLCPLELDSFEVLDNSLFIATITGTVAIEASVRGKCTLYFGNPDYRGMTGTYSVSEVLNDSELISRIIEQKLNPEMEGVATSYDWFYYNSFSTATTISTNLDWELSWCAANEALKNLLEVEKLHL